MGELKMKPDKLTNTTAGVSEIILENREEKPVLIFLLK